jgi:hypothetical protein
MTAAMQYKVKATDASYSSTRREDLVQLLDTANEETRRLEAELQALQESRDKLKAGAADARVAEAEAEKRLATLKILAGTSPARVGDPSRHLRPAGQGRPRPAARRRPGATGRGCRGDRGQRLGTGGRVHLVRHQPLPARSSPTARPSPGRSSST